MRQFYVLVIDNLDSFANMRGIIFYNFVLIFFFHSPVVTTSNGKLQIEVKIYSFSNSVQVCELSSLLRQLLL